MIAGLDLEAVRAVRAALETAPDPIAAAQIGGQIKAHRGIAQLTAVDLAAILDSEVAAGRAFRYGPSEAPRYWPGDEDAYVKALIGRQLAHKPMTAAGLHKHVAPRIPGYSPARVTALLEQLVAAKGVHRLPGRPGERAGRFSAVPPDPKAHLEGLIAGFLRGLEREVAHLEALGIARAEGYGIARELLLEHPLLAEKGVEGGEPGAGSRYLTGVALEQHILESLRALGRTRRHGGLVAVRELRETIGPRCRDKARFDAALGALAKSDRVWLYRHDFPASLSPAEREGMWVDAQGAYYNGVSLRE
jgi:hypothetical protein